MQKTALSVGVAVVVLAALAWFFLMDKKVTAVPTETQMQSTTTVSSVPDAEPVAQQGAAIGDENLVTFTCATGKTITAVFERDIVALTLSDGRQMKLRQSRTGSGISYLSNDSSVEFRGKGSEGMLVERGTETYTACTVADR